MPVLDHPVHPSTRIGAEHRYGCWNRNDRFAKHYWAPERRFFPDGSFEMTSVRVPFRNSHDCHHFKDRLSDALDPRCEGCRHYG